MDGKIARSINGRVGHLLLEERRLKGRSIRSVARKLKIKRRSLKKWEAGLSSPPCNVFYALVQFYGKASFQKASELDLQLQIEKYERYLAEKATLDFVTRKIPAVIWAEKVQHKMAA